MKIRHSSAALSLGVAISAWPSRARATDAEVSASTATQGYAVSSPWGDPTVLRRRFLQTLELGVYPHAEQGSAGEPEVSVRLRLRMDADFGVSPGETQPSATNASFVPGLAAAPIDLMYGYVEGRRLAHGFLGFRAGRQYLIDSLGFWSFDGALVRVRTPAYVRAEVYAGFEQRGGLPLSSPRFERDGVFRGDRTNYNPFLYPQFQDSSLAPAYGFSLESDSIPLVHARIDFRRVQNTGTASLEQFPETTGALAPPATLEQTRLSSQRLGASADLTPAEWVTLRGGLAYDFYAALFGSWYTAADLSIGKPLTLGLDYDEYRPTFDADSIFNFFATGPMRTATARSSVAIDERMSAAASAGIRSFGTSGSVDTLGDVSASYRDAVHRITLRALGENGERGHRVGGDLSGERRFMGGRFSTMARTSLYDWKDALRGRGAASFAYVLGARFAPGPRTSIMAEWEHDVNDLVGMRYRVLMLFAVAVP